MSPITTFDRVAPGHIIKESQFDPASHRCASPTCAGGRWDVQCLSAAEQLWRVSSEENGSYLVAGVMPACPWCGADLEIAAESHDRPLANGLLQLMNGSHQPGQASNAAQWN